MPSGTTGGPAGAGASDGTRRSSPPPVAAQTASNAQPDFQLPDVTTQGAAQGQGTTRRSGAPAAPAPSRPPASVSQASQASPASQPAAAGAGRSLGVGGQRGAQVQAHTGMRAAVPSAPLRLPSITSQVRAIRQNNDVARQALDELSLLAHELSALPDLLDQGGLARMHWTTYTEALREYMKLAQDAWEAVAEERLEQAGAEKEYRERAVLITRRVGRLKRESELAASNTQFPLPHKRPYFWEWRVRMLRAGLRAWDRSLGLPADALTMGRGLFALRGAAGLVWAGGLDVTLLQLLAGFTYTALALSFVGALLLVILVALISTGALPGPLPDALSYLSPDVAGLEAAGGAAVVTLALWLLVRLLLTASHAPLELLLGSSIFAANRSPTNGGHGSEIGAALLRGVSLLLMGLGVLGMPVAVVLAAFQQQDVLLPLYTPTDLAGWLAAAGNLLVRLAIPGAVVGVAATLLLGIIVLLVAVWRFTAELAGHRSWMPAGRAYALQPALTVLGFLSIALLAGIAAGTALGGWLPVPFVAVSQGTFTLGISLRTVALFLALVLPYFLLLELPYRLGIGRWRFSWLGELEARRADVESHIRRLSAITAENAAQEASDESLRAMQYDLVLLQFYRTKAEEANLVSPAPMPLLGVAAIVLLGVVVALLIDGGAEALLHLIPGA